MRILVDDLRSFPDTAPALVARTSAAGVVLLQRYREQHLDELWLDHDLGGDDTIWPVVELLERAAFDGAPYDIGIVHVHSANPPGAAKVLQTLRRWSYNARLTVFPA
ncbi:cyclic-phosphate processing receiver domain-containing protein [Dactylosporangium salmoneum]|uniref:cyclic-phosphate processing receiver domain-containing protein n=1 Tax=Dactylosporangium salmoneum TaxID=53361 RepID=UPI0031DB7413